VTKEKKPQKR